MKTKTFFVILLTLVAAATYAQTFTPVQPNSTTMQSQQIISTGTKYSGTVYEPFNNMAPSEYSAPGESYSPQRTGPRKLGGGTDPGQQSEEYPIGEPWIMVLFALAACGVIAYRRKAKV